MNFNEQMNSWRQTTLPEFAAPKPLFAPVKPFEPLRVTEHTPLIDANGFIDLNVYDNLQEDLQIQKRLQEGADGGPSDGVGNGCSDSLRTLLDRKENR